MYDISYRPSAQTFPDLAPSNCQSLSPRTLEQPRTGGTLWNFPVIEKPRSPEPKALGKPSADSQPTQTEPYRADIERVFEKSRARSLRSLALKRCSFLALFSSLERSASRALSGLKCYESQSDPTLLNPRSGYYTLSGKNILPVFDGKCPI